MWKGENENMGSFVFVFVCFFLFDSFVSAIKAADSKLWDLVPMPAGVPLSALSG